MYCSNATAVEQPFYSLCTDILETTDISTEQQLAGVAYNKLTYSKPKRKETPPKQADAAFAIQ